MNRHLRSGLVWLGALAMLLGAPGSLPGQTFDQVYGPKGVPIDGTVTRITKMYVKIQSRGGEKTISTDQIRTINFADDPPELNRGRQLVLEKRYKEAVEELGKIDMSRVKQDLIKQDILFYRALAASKLALKGEGSLVEAARLMVAFTNEPANQNSYHFYQATEMTGALAFALGHFDTAEQMYKVLYAAPGTDIKVRARVRVAECQLAQEKYNEAGRTFDEVLGADLSGYEKGDEQKMFAKVGKAVCLASSGKPDEGIKQIEQIIKTGDPKNMALFGRAYNALGACHLKAGRKKDALLAYLHTDVLFYGDPDAHAEALYHLSELWFDVKKSDRAVRARNRLKSLYGGTLWARKE